MGTYRINSAAACDRADALYSLVMIGSISGGTDGPQVFSDKQNKLSRNRFQSFRANSCC